MAASKTGLQSKLPCSKAGMTHQSDLTAFEIGVRRVGEVLLGCVMGLVVSWCMSFIWPTPEPKKP